MTTLRLPVTINGQTRDVECAQVRDDLAWTCRPVGLFVKRLGMGGKQWTARVHFFRQADGTWKQSNTTTILNRSGYQLIGWAEDVTSASAHNSARGR